MIDNKIYNIRANELNNIRQEAETMGAYLVEIQGEETQSWDDYLDKIEVAFRFPNEWRVTIDGYIDWMQDLAWLEQDSYILLIHDYPQFLIQALETRKMVMEIFDNVILPWWQTDVEKYCIDGKAKSFNIYLVS